MYYISTLTLINFSRRLDVHTAEILARISGLFANFKFDNDRMPNRQSATITINRPFSWQTLDLFLGFCTGMGRPIDREIDIVVEFIVICSFFNGV